MEDKIVSPAGMSMGSADENWSDISIHQSAMQGCPTACLLKPHLSCTNTVYMSITFYLFIYLFAYEIWSLVNFFSPKMDSENVKIGMV